MFSVEFRDKHTWDLAVPDAAVFVHSFSDNHSYIEKSKGGVPVGGDSVLPWVDGGGFLGGSARQSIPVQPGDELIDVIDHLAAFKSVENLRYGSARDAVRRAAMERLTQHAEAQLGRLDAGAIRAPAPRAPGRELERPVVNSAASRSER